jgi:hypothetical protein
MKQIELCEVKYFKKNKHFHKELGVTTACVVNMAQGTCQTSIDVTVETHDSGL